MFESWLGAEMGRGPRCAACARHAEGAEAAALRRDAQALGVWAPGLGGGLMCVAQPHGGWGARRARLRGVSRASRGEAPCTPPPGAAPLAARRPAGRAPVAARRRAAPTGNGSATM